VSNGADHRDTWYPGLTRPFSAPRSIVDQIAPEVLVLAEKLVE
jgi:hypothetical protein